MKVFKNHLDIVQNKSNINNKNPVLSHSDEIQVLLSTKYALISVVANREN